MNDAEAREHYGRNGEVSSTQEAHRTNWLRKVSRYMHRYFDAYLGTGPYEGEEKRDQVGEGIVVGGLTGNLISSEVAETHLGPGTGEHTVALDIDHEVHLEPSSTPGHYHLFIDHKMPWDDYARLITVMGEVGLLEGGYVAASLHRKGTHLRLPWVRKSDMPESPALGEPSLRDLIPTQLNPELF